MPIHNTETGHERAMRRQMQSTAYTTRWDGLACGSDTRVGLNRTGASSAARDDLPERAVLLIRDDVECPFRPLAHVPDALASVR